MTENLSEKDYFGFCLVAPHASLQLADADADTFGIYMTNHKTMFTPFPPKSTRRLLADALQWLCDRVNPNYDYWIQRRCRMAFIEVNAKNVVLTWLDKPVDRDAFDLAMKKLELHVMKEESDGIDSLDKLNQKITQTLELNHKLQKEIDTLKGTGFKPFIF
jgi:hypothetical protein